MKKIKTYKLFESVDNIPTLAKFLLDLQDELDSHEFQVVIGGSDPRNSRRNVRNVDDLKHTIDFYIFTDGAIEINLKSDINACYIDFAISDFSIQNLKDACNSRLDDDKSGWNCSDDVKDNYDVLCTAILSFLDKNDYVEIQKTDFGVWKEIVKSVADNDQETFYNIQHLMKKYSITKK